MLYSSHPLCLYSSTRTLSGRKDKTVYIIAGPTAVGKTAIAIALAQRLGTAIVSADSRQCYHEMNICTARPSVAELQAAKHYFVDAFPVATELSAANYESLALGYLSEIFTASDTAVICGGTGLYIKALCEGLDEMPEVDSVIIEKLEADYKLHGLEWLQQRTREEDPLFYTNGEMQNPSRMLRALSFIRTTGSSIVNYRTNTRKQRPFRIVKVGLELPREVLYARINTRVDTMMAMGIEAEVRALYPMKELKNLQTVGYKELFDYIDGMCTLNEAIEKIKQHTRNYAKRQLTWFKKDQEFTWLAANDAAIVDKILLL